MRAWERGNVGVVALVFLFVCGPLAAQTQPATVILVRHAEKGDAPKDDPPLNGAGQERTLELLKMLRHAGVDVVYHSNRVRTYQTAKILNDSLKVSMIEVPLTKLDAWVTDVVQRVRKGGVSVVVGHSNTYGPVIKALGGPDIEEIADPRYDDVFILTIQDGKPTRMIRAKYGRRWSTETQP